MKKLIIAAAIAISFATPAMAQERYMPPPAIEYGNESYRNNDSYDGANDAIDAANDIANRSLREGCMMRAQTDYQVRQCY